MKKLIFSLPFLIFIIAVGFFFKGLSQDPSLLPSTLIDESAPAFNLPTLQKPQEMLTQKIFQNHVTMLNVFASWCGICAHEHPFLMDIAAQHTVTIVGLNYKDDRGNALAYLKRFGDPYKEVLFDDSGNAAINYGVYGTPETFIIDKHGVIRDKFIGAITPKIWQMELLPLINKLQAEK